MAAGPVPRGERDRGARDAAPRPSGQLRDVDGGVRAVGERNDRSARHPGTQPRRARFRVRAVQLGVGPAQPDRDVLVRDRSQSVGHPGQIGAAAHRTEVEPHRHRRAARPQRLVQPRDHQRMHPGLPQLRDTVAFAHRPARAAVVVRREVAGGAVRSGDGRMQVRQTPRHHPVSACHVVRIPRVLGGLCGDVELGVCAPALRRYRAKCPTAVGVAGDLR